MPGWLGGCAWVDLLYFVWNGHEHWQATQQRQDRMSVCGRVVHQRDTAWRGYLCVVSSWSGAGTTAVSVVVGGPYLVVTTVWDVSVRRVACINQAARSALRKPTRPRIALFACRAPMARTMRVVGKSAYRVPAAST